MRHTAADRSHNIRPTKPSTRNHLFFTTVLTTFSRRSKAFRSLSAKSMLGWNLTLLSARDMSKSKGRVDNCVVIILCHSLFFVVVTVSTALEYEYMDL